MDKARSSDNAPSKHHFLPVFYQKRWAIGGRLIEYRRRGNGKIEGRSTYPKGSGYRRDLYKMHGAAPEQAQGVERDFMKPLDDRASNVLEKLRKGVDQSDIPIRERYAWCAFLISLLVRTPDDIDQHRNTSAEIMAAIKHVSVDEYLAENPSVSRQEAQAIADEYAGDAEDEKFAFRMLMKFIAESDVLKTIFDMKWRVRTLRPSSPKLITSDSPVFFSPMFNTPRGVCVMPIGPRSIFIASGSDDAERKVTRMPKYKLATVLNDYVVKSARDVVYAQDARSENYILKRMSTARSARLLERMAVNKEIIINDLTK